MHAAKIFTTGGTEEHRGTQGEPRLRNFPCASPVFLCVPRGKALCESLRDAPALTEVCSLPVIWFSLDAGLHRSQGVAQNLPGWQSGCASPARYFIQCAKG